jgi:hyaluronoglucosaminidase
VAGEGVIRGVIEGFYGPPWSQEERLDMIRFCADEGFDTWVHAPKDDPFHRAKWREPYPDDELARMGELVAECARVGVEFAYAIAPGLSIDYESAKDFAALKAKCEQVRSVGVGAFQLLWDDIESKDGAGQARVSNRFAAEVEQAGPLVICPVGYANTEETDYRRSLRGPLDPEIVVYWTGPEIVSHAIAREELDWAVERFGGRELLIWDNYPVNDFAVETLFLGPLLGRDPRLFDGHCAGLIANAMVQATPSKLPLATVADFLRDPHGYDPHASFERARARYGAEVVAALGVEPAQVERPDDLVRALEFGVDAPTAVALLS